MSQSGDPWDRGPRAIGSIAKVETEAMQHVDQLCRAAVAGKLAVRDIAAWVRSFELSETEFRLLWALAERSGAGDAGRTCNQVALAERLAVSAAQVSGAVERLGKQGLIEAGRDGDDRRRQLWRLTEAGAARVHAVLVRLSALRAAEDAA